MARTRLSSGRALMTLGPVVLVLAGLGLGSIVGAGTAAEQDDVDIGAALADDPRFTPRQVRWSGHGETVTFRQYDLSPAHRALTGAAPEGALLGTLDEFLERFVERGGRGEAEAILSLWSPASRERVRGEITPELLEVQAERFGKLGDMLLLGVVPREEGTLLLITDFEWADPEYAAASSVLIPYHVRLEEGRWLMVEGDRSNALGQHALQIVNETAP